LFCCVLSSDIMTALFRLGDYELPNDMMHTIMSFMTTEELYEGRRVCKNWENSVRDKEFALFYNKFSKANKESHLLSIDCGNYLDPYRIFITISKRYINSEKWHQIIPRVGFNPLVKLFVLGSIDGLICLQTDPRHSKLFFVICNPVTGQTINVKPPTNENDISKFFFFFSIICSRCTLLIRYVHTIYHL